MEDILEGESEKLIRRHPHVYGDVSAQDSETVKQNWEKIKLSEGNRSVLAGVPRSLPAMIKAQRIQEKAHGVGFDWGDTEGVWDKVQEELSELRTEVQRGDRERAAAELGDVLFSLVNYAQHWVSVPTTPWNARTKNSSPASPKWSAPSPRTGRNSAK